MDAVQAGATNARRGLTTARSKGPCAWLRPTVPSPIATCSLLLWCDQLQRDYAEACRIAEPFQKQVLGEIPITTAWQLNHLWDEAEALADQIAAAQPQTPRGRRARASALFMHEAQTVCAPGTRH
jgi:hypothetical protein